MLTIEENEEKKAFLRQYLKSKRLQAGIEDEIATLRASAILPPSGSDGMPHGTTKSDLSGYAAKIDDLERKLKDELEHGWELRRKVIETIETLPSELNDAPEMVYRSANRMPDI